MPQFYGKDELKAVGTSGMLLHTNTITLRHNLEDHNLKILFIMMYTAAYSLKPMFTLKHFSLYNFFLIHIKMSCLLQLPYEYIALITD